MIFISINKTAWCEYHFDDACATIYPIYGRYRYAYEDPHTYIVYTQEVL